MPRFAYPQNADAYPNRGEEWFGKGRRDRAIADDIALADIPQVAAYDKGAKEFGRAVRLDVAAVHVDRRPGTHPLYPTPCCSYTSRECVQAKMTAPNSSRLSRRSTVRSRETAFFLGEFELSHRAASIRPHEYLA